MTKRRPADLAVPFVVLAATAALGACTPVPAAHAAGDGSKQTACFGAAAEVLVSDAPQAGALRLAGGRLFWRDGQKGYAMSELDLATSRVERRPGKYLQLDTMDARQSFWTTSSNDLMVADLATMKVKILVPGHERMEDPIVWSSLAIDDVYVYYGRDAFPPLHEAGLFRMRRDGVGKEERIAPSPDLNQPFVAGAGFVYWFSRHQEKSTLLRRALTPGAPEQVVAYLPAYTPKAFMALAGKRLYFVDRGALRSVSVDGSEPPRQQLALGNAKVTSLVVEPPCLYFVSDGRIKRAALDADPSQTPETIADGETFDGGDVVTDGRFLYWADSKRGRILRAGPSRKAVPPRDELLATRAPEQPRRPVHPSLLALAEGWGCVHLGREYPARPSWECWRAGSRVTTDGVAVIAAQPVAKLVGLGVASERDRVCLVAGSVPRCWTWNELTDGAPADFSEQAAEQPTAMLSLGGSFRCTTEAQTLACTGDNRYGQLANGTGGDGADQRSHNYHADGSVLGGWHGCQMRVNVGTYCWGRGDAGQLGFPAPDTCNVGGRNILCSTKPRRLPLPEDRFYILKAGDMFTCAATDHLRCWGGSRDGAFGTAGDCPAELRQAWPTATGSVAAPKATCARTPVELPGFVEQKRGGLRFDVGARGICAIVAGELRCAGAIPTPRLPAKPLTLAVQRGDQPAACVSTERDVYCWGAGYSPPDDLAAPVRIALAAQSEKRSGAPIVDAPRPGGWEAECAANFACEVETRPLPACAAGGNPGAVSWSELVGRAAHLAGQTIQVRGPLVLGPEEDDGCSIGEPCCHGRYRRAIAIGGPEGKLALDGLYCVGDGSRLCCNQRAYGQQVFATGKLVDTNGRWMLTSAHVCVSGGQ